MLHRKKIEIEKKTLYDRKLQEYIFLVILSSCEKSQICFFLNVLYSQFECFQSFRYARRRSEVTVNDRLRAAAPFSLSMLKVQRVQGRGAYFNCG